MLCPLMVVACFGFLPALVQSLDANQCQGGFNYLVASTNGSFYMLVGLPSSLKTQYANHTAQISVEGTYLPSSSNQTPNFRGVIYVSQYVINSTTYTYAETVVMVSGTITGTSTNTRQISQTTFTGITGTVTLTPITVTGLLDYAVGYCINPQLTTTTSPTPTEGNSTPALPGFPALAIILGLLTGLSIMLINKRRVRDVKL